MNTAFTNEAIEGAATNVGVQLYDGANTEVSPDEVIDVTSALTPNSDATASEAHIPFTARMIAVGDAASAGSLVSHADYTISYQ